MNESGPIYVTDPGPRDDAISAVRLVVEYHDAEEFVRVCKDMLAKGTGTVSPREEVQRGMLVTLVLTFPGLVRPLHVAARVTEVETAGERKGRARVELIHLDRDRIAAMASHLELIAAGDTNYVVRTVRVLVVEDNPHCARLIQEGLRLAGKRAFGNRVAFDVPVASNAADALTFLHSQQIDVLITDIYLGGVSGTTVIEHVRADSGLRKMPVIAISAGDDATRDAALDAGADVFLPKPVRLRQIVGTVGEVLHIEQTAWR